MLFKYIKSEDLKQFLLSYTIKLFEEDSEDMLSYVLKADALKKGLININEEDAVDKLIELIKDNGDWHE